MFWQCTVSPKIGWNTSLKIFILLSFCSLQEMLGELFTPIETPEAQNRGFLKGFFGGNAHTFDREELCASFYYLIITYHTIPVCIASRNLTYSLRKHKTINPFKINSIVKIYIKSTTKIAVYKNVILPDVVPSWWGGSWEGFPESGTAHPWSGRRRRHESGSEWSSGGAGTGSYCSGWERPEAWGAGGADRSDDDQCRNFLQTCSWGEDKRQYLGLRVHSEGRHTVSNISYVCTMLWFYWLLFCHISLTSLYLSFITMLSLMPMIFGISNTKNIFYFTSGREKSIQFEGVVFER